MAVSIKSQKEIALMREAGKKLAYVHDFIAEYVVPGVSTHELNARIATEIQKLGCIPSFLNFEGFPAAACISVNEAVVHGVPSKKFFLKEGDIVSIDIGLIHERYHSDAARTHGVGVVGPRASRLMEVTKQSFFEGIKFARAGLHLHQISAAIEDYVTDHGYSCVRDLVGHGIGTQMHEDPQIPNFHQRNRGLKLLPGMTLAIEPMVNEGRPDVVRLDDEWTVVTQDGTLSAHYENTILVGIGEPEILSLNV